MILLSGPCVIENEKNLYTIAKGLEFANNDKTIDFYFKASFDKANRTSLDGFRGPGLKDGLALLQKIKNDFGYKIITDVHETSQVKSIADVVDIIQIPAFLCRQTDLIVESAKTKIIVNIKKGQFMNPVDMQYSVLKALKTRDSTLSDLNIQNNFYELSNRHGIWLTERGSSFGYGNLVVDMRSLVIMRRFAPVIFDATHSVQMPGGLGGKSGGDSSFVPYLARAAASVGVDGFFMETHFNPKESLSDGANMIALDKLTGLIEELKQLDSLAHK
ncbi:3-deoxy-8-phosphooctulonate synthase [Helicobacter muridarum]|uniref:2-dehydro-3-deoxyphosphooctonate aldolase n=1 Tax=Helicobacter muridarum TaxID=216 RepID=A0A377PTY6_9HELI|nr:3-deoxy-8-phosphooctulonate synthase [Helicobacter muridarum]TLE00363.1 3-deoxy-8-phosphooctulonate synthase [Helicobacter muridarum]STQ85872.1 2-dehydro-3-deoxyphosphooctonate aldolase [Helicobacter muridarum]